MASQQEKSLYNDASRYLEKLQFLERLGIPLTDATILATLSWGHKNSDNDEITINIVTIHHYFKKKLKCEDESLSYLLDPYYPYSKNVLEEIENYCRKNL